MKVNVKEPVVDITSIDAGDLIVVKGINEEYSIRLIVRALNGIMAINLSNGWVGKTEATLSELVEFYTTRGFEIVRVIKSENLELKEI